ncbi:MAG TPA: alpha/beta hydrolase [Pyrinomonadaceae bacterium]|nr:alpha/beta hydrolase [Pyrinomonadaceae bacterium]HMP64610.1 alpha/beta hydrolase [Pyrinomonadaceae bacterium]
MKKRDLVIGAGGIAAGAIVVKMLTRPRSVAWKDVARVVPHSDRSDFIDIDGIRIHFQQFGDPAAPTLLLIHGFTASVYVWKTAAPLLAESGFNVVALDLVGFGYSEKPAWFDYTINSQARIVSRFMDRLGIGKAVVVGSSYGGAVAATLALDYPARVEKLVLVNAVINDDAKKHPILRLASIPGVGEIITPLLVDSRAFLRLRMHGTLAPANHHMITGERISSIQRPLKAADAHNSVLATSRNWHAKRIEQDAHLIVQPTLLIWGEEDKVIPLENGLKLYNSVLKSRLIVFKDCGHVPQEEKSETFAELVAEFCRDRKGRVESKERGILFEELS